MVAAAVGGLPTAVEDGVSGVLVDGHDPADYAAAIRKVVEQRELLSAGARRHATRFSWDRTAGSLVDAYSAAMAEMAVPPLVRSPRDRVRDAVRALSASGVTR